ELETDGRARSCELANGHVRHYGPFDSAEGGLAHSHTFGRRSQAQARAPPGQADLRSRDPMDPRRLLKAAIQSPLTGRHGADDGVGYLPATHLAFIGRHVAERIKERRLCGAPDPFRSGAAPIPLR